MAEVVVHEVGEHPEAEAHLEAEEEAIEAVELEEVHIIKTKIKAKATGIKVITGITITKITTR